MKDTIERKYKRVRLAIMREPCYMPMAPVMLLGKQSLSDTMPTACTDGYNEIYGRKLIRQLGEPELGFVILHENEHKVQRHTVTYRKLWEESRQLANAATDYWINLRLFKWSQDPRPKFKIAMPTYTQEMWEELSDKQREQLSKKGLRVGSYFGLLDFRFEGMTVPEIFRLLKQEGEGGDGEGGGDGGGNERGDGGFDEHDWEEELTPEQAEQARQEIERALREGEMLAKRHGLGSAGLDLGLSQLLAPKVNWKRELRQFVTATCRKPQVSTWRRLNRRFMSMGYSMPTTQGKAIKQLVVGVDASGSMFGGTPTPFVSVMSEVEGLVKQLQVDSIHLVYWDGYVCQHEKYTPATVGGWKQVTKPKGGGGTNPACVPPHLKKEGVKPDAVIMLTDGEVPEWGQWDSPVLWVIKNRQNIKAKTGKTINLPNEE